MSHLCSPLVNRGKENSDGMMGHSGVKEEERKEGKKRRGEGAGAGAGAGKKRRKKINYL